MFIIKSPSKLGQKRHTPVEFSHLGYCDITRNNLGLCPRLLSISLFWSIAPHTWMFGNEKHLYVQQRSDWQQRSQMVNRCGGSNGNTPHRLLDPRWWCCLGRQRRCGLAGRCMSPDRGSGSLKMHAISSLFSLLCRIRRLSLCSRCHACLLPGFPAMMTMNSWKARLPLLFIRLPWWWCFITTMDK